MGRSKTIAAVLLVAAATGVTAILLLGGDETGAFPNPDRETLGPAPRASFAAPSLYPSFAGSRHHYVARCEAGSVRVSVDAGPGTRVEVGSGAARSGSFEAVARAGPGEDFEVIAARGGSRESYEVRCLPVGFPDWGYERLREPPPGLFTVSVKGEDGTPWVIVFDQGGVPRWWDTPATQTLWSQVLGNGTVTWSRAFGDGYGLDPRMAHEVHSLSGEPLGLVRSRGTITDGHEFHELPGGNVLLDSYNPRPGFDLSSFSRPHSRHPGPADAPVALAEIQEVDPAGDVIWRWNSYRRISLAETGRWWHSVLANPHPGPGGAPTYDAVHINAIEPFGPDRVIIATRHTDAIYCIERSTGRILWKLGGTPTPDSLRILGDPYPRNQLFGGPHDVRVDADGTLSVYDDATHRPRPPRLVRYRLDLDARTATFLDQFTDPQITASHCCGSARPMGGGWLVDWGDNPLVTGFDAAGRIAFRLHLPTSTYRAVPVPSGAVPEGGFDLALEPAEPGGSAP